MRYVRCVTVFFLAAGVAVAGCGQPPADTGAGRSAAAPATAPQAAGDPEQLRSREQQRVGYLVSGDFDRLEAMLSPTLSYTHSNGALDDRARFLNTLRSGDVVYRSMTHREVEVRFVRPGVAVLNGISDAVVSIGGQDQDVPLRFTMVYVERAGEWVLEAWHSARRAAG